MPKQYLKIILAILPSIIVLCLVLTVGLVWAQPLGKGQTALPNLAEGKIESIKSSVGPKTSRPLDAKTLCQSGQTPVCSSPLFSQLGISSQCTCEELTNSNPSNSCRYFTLVNRRDNDQNFRQEGQSMTEWTPNSPVGKDPSKLPCIQQIMSSCSSDGKMKSGVNEVFTKDTDFCVANKISELLLTAKNWGPRLKDLNSGVFDMSCKAIPEVNPSEICGSLTFRYLPSPISLLWTAQTDINSQISVTNFSLNPSTANKWFTWKASSQTPLLVYDPERTMFVKDVFQLFGHWTFGGKRFAGIRGSSLTDNASLKPMWEHGFKALATLDRNNDKKLTDSEIELLSLWFDNNQDGISQSGEIKTLTDVGVITLYYTPDHVDVKTYDIYAIKGYERIENGKRITGQAVDWFSEQFDSKGQAIERLKARHSLESTLSGVNKAVTSINPSVQSKTYFKETDNWPSSIWKTPQVSGIWRWQIEDDIDNLTSDSAYGILVLNQNSNYIFGNSYVELPLEENDKQLKSLITSAELSGKIFHDLENQTVISLKSKEKYQETTTQAYLAKDGTTLHGRSTTVLASPGADTVGKTISYSWMAHRIEDK